MICSKKACPVLQCAQKLHPPGECCPRCNGTRTLYPVPKTCTLQNAFVREGHNFNIDRCTNCTCKNETSICQRAACPVLDCAPDLQKSMPGNCCKKCVMSEELKTQCSYDGKSYEAIIIISKHKIFFNCMLLLDRMVNPGNWMLVDHVNAIEECLAVR